LNPKDLPLPPNIPKAPRLDVTYPLQQLPHGQQINENGLFNALNRLNIENNQSGAVSDPTKGQGNGALPWMNQQPNVDVGGGGVGTGGGYSGSSSSSGQGRQHQQKPLRLLA
jgi:hypothetical protein